LATHSNRRFKRELGTPSKTRAQSLSVRGVNWFRKSDDRKFVWPGYGESMSLLKWMIDRIEDQAHGKVNVFGVSPTYEKINWTVLNFTSDQFKAV
jgi:phosphoenolpyruvate carboxykinase (GTP)